MFKNVLEKIIIVAGVAAGAVFMQQTPDAPAASDTTTVRTVVAAAEAPTLPADDTVSGFNCATGGNHVCGPDNSDGIPAGCYDNGTLVVPWSRYDDPQSDPLYGQRFSPCAGQAPTQEQESDAAYAAAQVHAVAAVRPAAGSCSERTPAPGATPAPTTSPAPRALVNLNTATDAELDALPNIAAKRIGQIKSLRPLGSVDDLRKIPGFPVASIRDRVTV